VGNLAEALGIAPDTLKTASGPVPAPKYLNLAGSHQNGALYNADAIASGGVDGGHRDVLIVEGGFDAALAGQILGDTCAVVTFGGAAQRPSARRLNQLRAAGRIFVLMDADEAGQSAAQRLMTALGGDSRPGDHKITIPDHNTSIPDHPARIPAHEATAPLVIPVRLPVGKDVTEYLIDHGGDLGALIRAACDTSAAADWRHGLPDGLRSALLRFFPPAAAPLMELVARAAAQGQINPAAFTLNDLIEAGRAQNYGLAASSLRRVFALLVDHFFSKLAAEERQSKGSNNEKNAGRGDAGRRADLFALRSRQAVHSAILAWAKPRIVEAYFPAGRDAAGEPVEAPRLARVRAAMLAVVDFDAEEAQDYAAQLDLRVEDWVESLDDLARARYQQAVRRAAGDFDQVRASLDDDHSTPLPEEFTLGKSGDYRAAFLRATNDPTERRSRRQIARLIGVSDASVGVMVNRAGLVRAHSEGEYEYRSVVAPGHVHAVARRGAREVQGFPRALVADYDDGRRREQPYEPDHPAAAAAAIAFVGAHLSAGARVSIRFQVANKYERREVMKQEPCPRSAGRATAQAAAPGATDHPTAADHSPAGDLPDVPDVPDAEKPARRPAVRPFYGPGFNPAWVEAQMRLAITLLEPERYAWRGEFDLLDTSTGEIFHEPTARELVGLLVGRDLRDPLIAELMALGGVRSSLKWPKKVRAARSDYPCG
jgi:hypothetical protein